MRATTHVFTYGTLLIAEVMEAVTGRRFASVPARLDGFERVCVRGAVYPGARRSSSGVLDGVLYLDVDADALARLDRFEGEMYERVVVTVSTGDGPREAAVYVVPAAFDDRLDTSAWDVEGFRRAHLPRYLARCRAGFVAAEEDAD